MSLNEKKKNQQYYTYPNNNGKQKKDNSSLRWKSIKMKIKQPKKNSENTHKIEEQEKERKLIE